MRHRCSTCRWWEADITLRQGLCRYDAPIITANTSLWPTTKESDWCGQYCEQRAERVPVAPYGADET